MALPTAKQGGQLVKLEPINGKQSEKKHQKSVNVSRQSVETCFKSKCVFVGGRSTCYSKVFLVRAEGGHWLKQCKQFLISNLAATTARSFYLTIWLGGDFQSSRYGALMVAFEANNERWNIWEFRIQFNNTVDNNFSCFVIKLSSGP